MPDGPRVSPAAVASPSPTVVSATLAELQETLEKERAAHQATEASLWTAEARAARLEAENAQRAEQISRLEHLVEEFRKALFGKKSEKLGGDERQLLFDDLGTAIAEAVPAERAPDEEAGVRQRRRRGPGSEVRFPAHLERITKVIEPNTIMCPCGYSAMTKIGVNGGTVKEAGPLDMSPSPGSRFRPRSAQSDCQLQHGWILERVQVNWWRGTPIWRGWAAK